MSVLRTVLSLVLLISLADTVCGDLLPSRSPLPKPPMAAPVKVVEENVDDKDPNVVAKIIIPQSLLPDLYESTDESRISNSFSIGTVVAGIAMAAAAISLLCGNRNSPQWKKGAVFFIGCVLIGGTALLTSSLFLPESRTTNADPSRKQQLILIEVEEFGHEVTLILPSRK